MRKMSTAQARESLADVVNDAAYAGTRTVITRRGKDVAAIVPITDLPQPDMPSAEGMTVVQVQQRYSPIAITSLTATAQAPISITIGDSPTSEA
jgi:prevent-host-death family protein